jgi:hypothetical protein
MAIIADGHSTGIYYTASYAPTLAKTQSNSSVQSSVALRNDREISQRGAKSNICLPSQSTAVISSRESASVLSTPNSLSNAKTQSLSYQVDQFLVVMDPGSCMVMTSPAALHCSRFTYPNTGIFLCDPRRICCASA